MITMDERTERRRSPLLGNPYPQRRRTLLSSDDSILPAARVAPEDGAAKRRKGLLSTPETGVQAKMATPQSDIVPPSAPDFNNRKRPALLPDSPAQMPLSSAHFKRQSSCPKPKETKPSLLASPSAVPSNATKLTAPSSERPSKQRRVLLSLSSEEKVLSPSAITTSSASASSPLVKAPVKSTDGSKPLSHHKASRVDSRHAAKTTLFEYLSSDSSNAGTAAGTSEQKKAVNKATMTEGRPKWTASDLSAETDLAWLHQQRALIDKRISELQDEAQANPEKKDLVAYVSGYYCQVCRKLIRGDYADKTAHCQEDSHVLNAEASANDPETVLKYFEEKYDGIAFDDDDDGEDAAAASELVESWTRQRTSETSADRWTKNRVGDDGSSCVGGTGDSDDDDEPESTCERFDRTRISRK